MPTYKGPYSADDSETDTGVGLDRDSYNPSDRPNVYVSNKRGLNKIDLSSKIDGNGFDSIGTEGDGWAGGFSGQLSKFRNHPK
jgi:hypothetical protein